MRALPLKDAIVSVAREELSAVADARKAREMAAYMKTDMPFFGVQKPEREKILSVLKRECVPTSRKAYETSIRALWNESERECKYLAIRYARAFPEHIVPASMPLYQRLIVEGAWWDFVDEVAVQIVGPLLLREPDRLEPTMTKWLKSSDMWLRRSAIVVRLKHKDQTNQARLFEACERCLGENEFFIRKAIGWALREYAKTRPEAVRRFLREHRQALSALSFREASKHLGDV